MTHRTLTGIVIALAYSGATAADLTVSAAASLTNAFTEIGQAYEQQHPDSHIHFNFAGSGALLQQILNGAPVDVFASADQLRMDKADQAGLIAPDSRQDFAQNTLVVIAPKDNAHPYQNLSDIIHAPTIQRIAIANTESVPAGRYTKTALEAAKLWQDVGAKNIPTENVRQALDYVARKEADIGFVYRTDAAIMPEKVSVVLDVPLDIPLTYPIAAIKDSAQLEEAKNFIRFVTHGDGQAILHKYGFLSP